MDVMVIMGIELVLMETIMVSVACNEATEAEVESIKQKFIKGAFIKQKREFRQGVKTG